MHPQKKLRKRAQEVIARLHSKLFSAVPDMTRNGVRLEFLAEDPSIDFVEYKLRLELPDDWLIASALEWRQRHPGDETRIVSADLGISIRSEERRVGKEC